MDASVPSELQAPRQRPTTIEAARSAARMWARTSRAAPEPRIPRAFEPFSPALTRAPNRGPLGSSGGYS
jgi:hypothetical protein